MLPTLGEQMRRECFTPPLSGPISFAEVSSSRDSDLGRIGTNSTYPRIHEW